MKKCTHTHAQIHTHTYTPVWSRASPAAPRDSTKDLLYPLYELCVSQESSGSVREGPQIAFSWHGCLFALWSSRTPSKGLAFAFWRAWHIVFEKKRVARGCEKEKGRVSVLTDEQTYKTDRQRTGLSVKVFSVHSYEKEYSARSPPSYLLLVFTLVSFLVNLVHECRATRWVGRDFFLILTSPPIPNCILISSKLLSQCKTNTVCQGFYSAWS